MLLGENGFAPAPSPTGSKFKGDPHRLINVGIPKSSPTVNPLVHGPPDRQSARPSVHDKWLLTICEPDLGESLPDRDNAQCARALSARSLQIIQAAWTEYGVSASSPFETRNETLVEAFQNPHLF